MMSTAQALRIELASNPLKNDPEIPRIDLAKIDNVPYYIESKASVCHRDHRNLK